MKLVVDNEPKKATKKATKKRKWLNHEELCEKLQQTGGTHLDREQVVLQNLKNMGF